jgi:hypothetical protein
MLDQNQPIFDDQLELVYQQARYLAKINTKEHNPQGSWLCVGTREPKNNQLP